MQPSKLGDRWVHAHDMFVGVFICNKIAFTNAVPWTVCVHMQQDHFQKCCSLNCLCPYATRSLLEVLFPELSCVHLQQDHFQKCCSLNYPVSICSKITFRSAVPWTILCPSAARSLSEMLFPELSCVHLQQDHFQKCCSLNYPVSICSKIAFRSAVPWTILCPSATRSLSEMLFPELSCVHMQQDRFQKCCSLNYPVSICNKIAFRNAVPWTILCPYATRSLSQMLFPELSCVHMQQDRFHKCCSLNYPVSICNKIAFRNAVPWTILCPYATRSLSEMLFPELSCVHLQQDHFQKCCSMNYPVSICSKITFRSAVPWTILCPSAARSLSEMLFPNCQLISCLVNKVSWCCKHIKGSKVFGGLVWSLAFICWSRLTTWWWIGYPKW